MRTSTTKRLAATAAVAVLACGLTTTALGVHGASASPSPGSLSPAFGGTGIVTTTVGDGSFTFAQGVALAKGNRFVAVGGAQQQDGTGLFGVALYATRGNLVRSFGSGGTVTTNFGLGGDNLATAVAIQTNDLPVVAGYAADTSDADYYWAIARYKRNGSLDSTFGNHGRVTTTFGLTYDFADAVTIQPDGKIVVVGSAGTHDGTQLIALARYNTNGSLDTSFGTGGLVTTQIGTATLSIAHGVALVGGTILVAGYTGNDLSDTEPVMVAYNADGSLDTSFGASGVETFSLPAGANAFNAISVRKSTIVAAGEDASSNSGDFFVAEVASDGTPVAGFGTGGTVDVDFASATDTAYAVGVDSLRRVVVVGDSLGATDQVAVARLLPNGSLDTGFGSGGTVTTNAGAGGSAAYAMAFQRLNQIVVAGVSLSAGQTSSQFLLARYQP